jgi:hypothetical protein
MRLIGTKAAHPTPNQLPLAKKELHLLSGAKVLPLQKTLEGRVRRRTNRSRRQPLHKKLLIKMYFTILLSYDN